MAAGRKEKKGKEERKEVHRSWHHRAPTRIHGFCGRAGPTPKEGISFFLFLLSLAGRSQNV
jgi:hypothetical protein